MYGEYEYNEKEEANEAIRQRAEAYERQESALESARLDFLQSDGTKHVYAISGLWHFRASEDAIPIPMPSLREAIDAARARQEGCS